MSFATGLVSVTAASIIDAVQWVQGLRQSTACRVPVYEALNNALKLSSVCSSRLNTKALSTLSQKSATVAENGEKTATVAEFGDSLTFLRQSPFSATNIIVAEVVASVGRL